MIQVTDDIIAFNDFLEDHNVLGKWQDLKEKNLSYGGAITDPTLFLSKSIPWNDEYEFWDNLNKKWLKYLKK